MEWLDGRELSDVLKELGTIDPLRAVRLCQAALAGLAEAHAQGLVHRDVKPANLFLIHEDKPDETVKVIDYGIALDLTGRVGAGHVPGDFVGTPMYMAPEQVTGKPLDGRCDLYAIAIVLYQCLSGKLPFTAENAIGLLMARLTQTPRPIAEVSAQPLPDGLAQILQRALEMDPDDRPPTADVMASALAKVQLMAGDSEAWKRSWRTHSHVGPLDPRTADTEDIATRILEP
jgi:serine/threonine-protein kinase